MEIITIGAGWGYNPVLCDDCPYLEKSIDEKMVACDSPNGVCTKTNKQVYEFVHGMNY